MKFMADECIFLVHYHFWVWSPVYVVQNQGFQCLALSGGGGSSNNKVSNNSCHHVHTCVTFVVYTLLSISLVLAFQILSINPTSRKSCYLHFIHERSGNLPRLHTDFAVLNLS